MKSDKKQTEDKPLKENANLTLWAFILQLITNPKTFIRVLYILVPMTIICIALTTLGYMGYKDGRLWIGANINYEKKDKAQIDEDKFCLVAPSRWIVDRGDTITLKITPEISIGNAGVEASEGLYIPSLSAAFLTQSRLRLRFTPKDEDAGVRYRTQTIDWGDPIKIKHVLKKFAPNGGTDLENYLEITFAEITDDCGKTHRIQAVTVRDTTKAATPITNTLINEKGKNAKINISSFY